MSCGQLTGVGHWQTISVPAGWQIPAERCVVAATEAAGCETDDLTACDAPPELEVCWVQAATMSAAANNAAGPAMVAIAVATRCTGASWSRRDECDSSDRQPSRVAPVVRIGADHNGDELSGRPGAQSATPYCW